MTQKEWEVVKETLRKPQDAKTRKEAAEAFRQYEKTRGKSSKPTLVSLGKDQGYPNAVPVDQIPNEIEKNPKFFDLMHKIVESG